MPSFLTAVNGYSHRLGDRVLLLVGRMSASEQYKGQDVMIQTMPHILTVCPQAQLVIVGKGDDTDRLLHLAQAQPTDVQAAIFMPGYVSDDILQRLYQQCYLFTMPSRGEGFGLVYLEAMRWAKPCLGSSVDAARCIIRNGETGVLVDNPTDAREVAEKIIDLLDDTAKAIDMGQRGRALLLNDSCFNTSNNGS